MGKPSGIWARGQHTVGPCPVPHSHECSCPSTGQGHCEPSLPQAQSPPPTLSILSTMSTGMPMSSACACTWPPPSQPPEKEGQQAHIFPDKVAGASGARGAVQEGVLPAAGAPFWRGAPAKVPAVPWDRPRAPTRCRNSVLSFFLFRHRAAATLFFSRRLFLLSSSSSS